MTATRSDSVRPGMSMLACLALVHGNPGIRRAVLGVTLNPLRGGRYGVRIVDRTVAAGLIERIDSDPRCATYRVTALGRATLVRLGVVL